MLHQITRSLLNNEYLNSRRITWVIYSNIRYNEWFTAINRNLVSIMRISLQLWLSWYHIKPFSPSVLFIILIYGRWMLLLPFCSVFWMKLFMWSNLIISLKTFRYIIFARLYIISSSFPRYSIWPSWISCTNLAFINQSQIIKFSFLRIN